MRALYLLLALVLVLVGHTFRLLRWEQFIRIYERPMRGRMLRGMAGGFYAAVPATGAALIADHVPGPQRAAQPDPPLRP